MSLKGQLEQQGLILDGTGAAMRSHAANGDLVRPSPNQGFWKDCPSLYYNDPSVAHYIFDDFGQIPVDDITTKPTNYTVSFDTSGTFTQASTSGGIVILTPHTDADDAICMQMGTHAFTITANSGKALWAEFNVKVTGAGTTAGAFVGLTTASYDWDTIFNAAHGTTGGTIKDSTNILGFRIGQVAPTTWKACYKTAAVAIVDQTAVTQSTAFFTFGIHFDGVTTVSFWVDRVKLATTANVSTDTAFPAALPLVPFMALMTATGAKIMTLDWVKVVQVR